MKRKPGKLFHAAMQISSSKKCKGCGKTMKNKKKYWIMGVKQYPSGRWVYRKKCKRCGYVNTPHKNEQTV